MSLARPSFVFTCCQRGAESALKSEIARVWPGWRFAFSRPGFVTFKLPDDEQLRDDFELHSVFARAYGLSLEKLAASDPISAAREVTRTAQQLGASRLHVWQRDVATPGYRGYEPSLTSEAADARQAILTCPSNERVLHGDPIAQLGELVLDCVLVEPNEWWLGYHRAIDLPGCYPGGLMPIELPPQAVSRAYLKMQEALLWSGLPVQPGQRCAEIGSAPGGASQALLGRGLHVVGIDPADMHPHVLADPRFTHIRKRGHEVRRREFRGIHWLTADINVAPSYTLDTVEAIVTHPEVHVRGMLLTLKLLSWQLADAIPQYLDRVRSWGYDDVRARQLQFNRQEICVAAQRFS